MQNRRRRGPRGDLSAELLLAAADRVLDAGGLRALSLRAVAREADVTPTALYTYFTDMADLRHRLGDRLLGRIDLDPLADAPGAAGLRQFLHHVLEVFSAAPGQVQILASQRILGPHALALNEALLTFFIDRVGHSPHAAAAATDLVTEWVHGTVLLAASNLEMPGPVSLADYPLTAAMLAAPGPDGAQAPARGTQNEAVAGPTDASASGTSLDLVVQAVTRTSR